MRQPFRASALVAVLLGIALPSSTARAQDRAAAPTISAVPLPGGLAAIRKVANDSGRSSAGAFFLDMIRRSFQAPVSVRGVRRDTVMRPILDHLDLAAKASLGPSADRVPLPMTPEVWARALLEPGAKAQLNTLAADILRSSAASLMYCGLLALDDETRGWFAAHPEVLTEIAVRHAANFLIAAPGLRIRNNVVDLPGGPPATGAWETAVGKSAGDARAFIKAVVVRNDVTVPYLLGSVAQLAREQTRLVLGLDAAEPARAAAMRRMVTVYERVVSGWDPNERPFWRPTLDPALLASDLRLRDDGAANLPGTTAFWTAVFSSSEPRADAPDVSALLAGPPVEFSWLCDQVFTSGHTLTRPPYQLVLFASRRIPATSATNVRVALAALRGASQFPALSGTLERAGITALDVYVDAARRARALSAISDDVRAQTALLQFQGAVAMIARAAVRGSVSADRAGGLVSTASAVNPDAQGEYAGKLVEWLTDTLLAERERTAAAAHVDDAASHARDVDLLSLLAGPAGDGGPILEWEGTRYRVSFSSTEALRLRHMLGESSRPYVTAADTMLRAAKTFESGTPSRQTLTASAEAIAAAAEATQCADPDEWATVDLSDRCRETLGALARAAKSGETKNAHRLAPRLRQLSDALLARGLLVMAYAAGFGQPDNAVISAFDAASRHNFGFGVPGYGRAGAWRWPGSGTNRVRDWHLIGSILGIDIALPQNALVRITSRPPSVRPSINDEDRVVLSESAVLMEPGLLTPDGHAMIVKTLKRGRERIAGLGSAADAEALAREIHMPAARRTLFVWTATENMPRAVASLATSDIFAAGLAGAPVPAQLDAWGVSGGPRLGCQCLQFPDRRPLDVFAGRWFSGVLATGFTDLNLRIAELLDELHMPGALLAPVLASATWDFLMNVRVDDFDDSSAWTEFAADIGLDRVEQYLALLTTDGPLVPFVEGSGLQ